MIVTIEYITHNNKEFKQIIPCDDMDHAIFLKVQLEKLRHVSDVCIKLQSPTEQADREAKMLKCTKPERSSECYAYRSGDCMNSFPCQKAGTYKPLQSPPEQADSKGENQRP